MNGGLWGLWAKGCAVGNAKRFPWQASRFAEGELSTNPQTFWFRRGSSKSPGVIQKPVPKHGASRRCLTDNPNGCWGQ